MQYLFYIKKEIFIFFRHYRQFLPTLAVICNKRPSMRRVLPVHILSLPYDIITAHRTVYIIREAVYHQPLRLYIIREAVYRTR
jgi:hypothetical protein